MHGWIDGDEKRTGDRRECERGRKRAMNIMLCLMRTGDG